jgi:hypothetical protein
MSWIKEHPEATHIEKIRALAFSLIGEANEPSAARKEAYGLDEDWEITDESNETCREFDSIVMRCEGCDWWCETEEVDEDGLCPDCRE